MATSEAHLTPSDLALAIWSVTMLVNRQDPLCAHLQSHTFVNMWTTCFSFCGKLLTPWGFNLSSSNIIDRQFSCLCAF